MIGLLLADGELDIEQLKKMLGVKRAREVLKEALASGLIEREAQLTAPHAKKRRRRDCAPGGRRRGTGSVAAKDRGSSAAKLHACGCANVLLTMCASDRRKVYQTRGLYPFLSRRFTLTAQDHVALLAQRQLAAVDLLQYGNNGSGDNAYWAPTQTV